MGKHLMLVFNQGDCQNSGECLRRLPKVFDRNRDPWVDLDQADPELIERTADHCPSGALSCQSLSPPKQTIGQLKPGGPIVIRGQMMIISENGQDRRQTQVASFCRCGQSKHKPYCDGTHEELDIIDSGEIRQISQQVSNSQGGIVRIECKKDGPLKFTGNLTVKNIRGQSCTKDKGELCRCGQSGDKPFCDGSHITTGFKSS